MNTFALRRIVIAFALAFSAFAGAASAATVTFKDASGATIAGPQSASANGGNSYTSIQASPSGELSVASIAQSWATLFSTDLTFQRILDKSSGNQSLSISSAPSTVSNYADKLWTGGSSIKFIADAAYSASNQYLSILSGSTGTSGFAANAITIKPTGANVAPGAIALTASAPATFRLARSATADGSSGIVTTADNSDSAVTFLVSGAGFSTPTYAVFFEDGTDGDFNDLGVLFQQSSTTASLSGIVPLPVSALPLGALFIAIAADRASKRR